MMCDCSLGGGAWPNAFTRRPNSFQNIRWPIQFSRQGKKGPKIRQSFISKAKLTMNSQVVWYRWNHLDETAFLTGPKPLVTDFDNNVMLELCYGKYFCLGIG